MAAIWTYDWIGWWCLVPTGAVCVWLAVNPKVFSPPWSLDHWASRAVLGEPYWGNRKHVSIPRRQRVAPNVLVAINTLGLPFVVWSLIALDIWIALFGLAVHMAGKNWFLDRMALLYDEMVEEPGAHDDDAAGNAQRGRDGLVMS